MMAESVIEHEICGNCKREIPQSNYVMHTAHCARNITLCRVCKEPIAKAQYEEHSKTCVEAPPRPSPRKKTPELPKTNLEKSPYFQSSKEVQDKKVAERREKYLERHEKFLDDSTSKKLGSQPQKVSESTTKVKNGKTYQSTCVGTTSKLVSNGIGAVKKESNGAIPKPNSGLMPCRYCELELPKVELEDHENYCGSRTDKCLDCGELVMFKYKQMHLDTNHGFLKLKDEPGPRPSWESTTQKSSSPPRRRRFEPTIYTDFSQFDPTDYLPSNYQIPKPKIEKGESYKEISRRLDCPAPQPPTRRRNPPTELCIPCEFCDTPIPHMELIEHQSGCRPDLFRRPLRRGQDLNDYFEAARAPSPVEEPRKSDLPQPARRQRKPKAELLIPCEFCDSPIPEDILIQHQTGCRPDLAQLGASAEGVSTPEVELPCEFCADMFPASQLYRHQATCG
ncbi:TRAF-type zinc finger domain-containing protein 1-like isoform X2 [Coccinella septempunctata]|uniref:TRAF-type zinc finger domain-containing protein 1-like isoform X2 n=1 Tax=Coccinella septempunctata TaxID=41139 RepID=UPI001D08BB9F|nr:TRAF-type zinc finger domain-containing protein 1-like isoform X2 [Coccinella septempunctata]